LIVLGLDTTGTHCTAALVSNTDLLRHKSENIGRGHAERLAVMVQEILAEEHLAARDVTRLAVCTGPGSFTGLRVAIAFARAFALPNKLPVIGLSALHILAAQADPHKEKKVVSIIDARRGDVVWGVYDCGEEIKPPVTQPLETAQAEISKLEYDHLVGDGAELMGRASSVSVVSGPALGWISRDVDPDAYPPTPLYARGPDAKLPGGLSL